VKDVLAAPRYKKPASWPMYLGTSVLQGLEMFANSDIHRIPIINRNNRIAGILTQSMVISLIGQNMRMLGPIKDDPVTALHEVLKDKVLTINQDARTIDGFKLMAENNVSGIAVVDSEGRIVTNLSIRDLRGIGTNAAKWRRLAQPVKDFKAMVRAEFPRQTPGEVLCVSQKDTVERVIQLMDDGNIHRIWEVAENLKPVHVISQGDLLRFLAKRLGLAQFRAGGTTTAGMTQPQPVGATQAKLQQQQQPQHPQPAGAGAAGGASTAAPMESSAV